MMQELLREQHLSESTLKKSIDDETEGEIWTSIIDFKIGNLEYHIQNYKFQLFKIRE